MAFDVCLFDAFS
ncbi:hypothetical protein NTH31_003716 [Vibrio mimicus]